MPTETVCPDCGGSGWKIIERADLSGAERCDCVFGERARRLEENAAIPPLYRNASFDNFALPRDNPIGHRELANVLLTVKAFSREFPTGKHLGLLLVGEPGTGKTHLAVAALRILISRGFEGLFFDYQNLLDRIRAGFNQASGSADREAYRFALDAGVLLLDDLGAHRVTDWGEDTVNSIITYACNNSKPQGYQQGVAQDRKAARPWMHELENLLAPQTEKHGGPIAFVESGTSINAGILDAPPPPLPVTVVSAHDPAAMNRSRQALATAGGALLWEDVEDALFPAGWERPGGPLYRAGAVSLSGDERPTVSALRRNAALLRHWAALLPGMKPERAPPVRLSTGKLPPGVTAMELVSRAPGVASAVSIANESRQPFRNMLRAWDPFTKRSIEIENVDLAPHQTLWLPVNVSLGGAGLCRECTAFSNAEHIVYATAELQTIEFENGTLAMEFCAPAPAEAVLQLARRPSGPYLAGGHLADFDFDEKTLRARLKIPQGKGPASQIRVALAIEAPEHSAFFEAAKRLIIGRVNTLSTSYSSEQLADRSRLRLPEGFAATPTKKSPLEIDYAVDVPAEALHGDWANLAFEADGVPLGRARLQLFRPASVHLAEAIRLHFGAAADLAVEPAIIPIDATAGRTVDVNIRNNSPGIETYAIEPAGDGFQFLRPKRS